MKNKHSIILGGMIVLIPLIWAFYFLHTYGTNVLVNDDYFIVQLYDSFQENGFSLTALWQLFGEHRMLVPRLILLVIVRFFNYNIMLVLGVALFFYILYYLLIIKYIKSKINTNTKTNALVFYFIVLLIGFLCFSGRQYETFLWGAAFFWPLIILCAGISFYAFSNYIVNSKIKYFGIFILFAVIASFSSLQGLFIWITILFFIIFLYLKKMYLNKRHLFYVGTIMLLTFIIYFYGYVKPDNHPSLFSEGLLPVINTFLMMLGTIAGGLNSYLSLAFGGIMLLLSIYYFSITITDQRRLIDNTFPLLLIIYGFITCASIAVGRSGFGIEDTGLTSRYTSYTLMIYIGVFLLMLNNHSITLVSYGMVLSGATTFIMIISCMQNIYLKQDYIAFKNGHEIVQHRTYYYKDYPDELLGVNTPLPELLEKYKLNIFDSKQYSPPQKEYPKEYFNDMINLGLEEHSNLNINDIHLTTDYLWMSGPWAFEFASQKPYAKIFVKINDKIFRCDYGMYRKDVAEAFQSKKLAFTGTEFSVNIQNENLAFPLNIQFFYVPVNENGYYTSSIFKITRETKYEN